MEFIFEIIDKTNRKIRLTKKQWNHIARKHPQMTNFKEEIEETLKNPLKITNYNLDENVKYYYKYLKNKFLKEKYLVVIVKYLNGAGFIISAFFQKYIK